MSSYKVLNFHFLQILRVSNKIPRHQLPSKNLTEWDVMRIMSLEFPKNSFSFPHNENSLRIYKLQLKIQEYRSSFEIYSNPSEATDNLPDVLYELPKLPINDSDNTKDLRLGSWKKNALYKYNNIRIFKRI